MDDWMLAGLIGAAVLVVGIALIWRRRGRASYPRTVIQVPPTPRPPPPTTTEVDLPLDLLPDIPDEPAARLGYRDSTVPAVQEPAPLRSARRG